MVWRAVDGPQRKLTGVLQPFSAFFGNGSECQEEEEYNKKPNVTTCQIDGERHISPVSRVDVPEGWK